MSILETAKDVYDLVKKGTTIDLQERVMTLREEALQLQEENIALKERVKALEEAATLKAALEWDGKVYYLKKAEGGVDGPFCQRCQDGDGKLVRLRRDRHNMPNGMEYTWFCQVCKASLSANHP